MTTTGITPPAWQANIKWKACLLTREVGATPEGEPIYVTEWVMRPKAVILHRGNQRLIFPVSRRWEKKAGQKTGRRIITFCDDRETFTHK
jgi:hypothetical protein